MGIVMSESSLVEFNPRRKIETPQKTQKPSEMIMTITYIPPLKKILDPLEGPLSFEAHFNLNLKTKKRFL